jgi:AraC family transcriptional regulator, ethanolamine operon transcriptional activator
MSLTGMTDRVDRNPLSTNPEGFRVSYRGSRRYGDVDELNEECRDWSVEFRQLGRGPFSAHYEHGSIGRVHLSSAFYTTGVCARGTAPPGACILSILPAGAPVYLQTGRLCIGQGTLSRPGQEYQLTSSQPFGVFSVVLDEVMLEDACRARWGLSLNDVATGSRIQYRSVGALHHAFLEMRALLDLLNGPRFRPERSSAIVGQAESAAVTILLDAMEPTAPRADDVGRRRIARRAEALIRERLGDSGGVSQIAAELNTTLRSLQTGFREVYGMTPHAYRTSLRMSSARTDLRRGSGTVSEVAVRWGFLHLGRFSVDYKRMFGESPSVTLRGGGPAPQRLAS